MSKWAEIRNDNYDVEERCICIDAWQTLNGNEEGKVIAKVYIDEAKVEYLDEDARTDVYAQEIIDEAVRDKYEGYYR